MVVQAVGHVLQAGKLTLGQTWDITAVALEPERPELAFQAYMHDNACGRPDGQHQVMADRIEAVKKISALSYLLCSGLCRKDSMKTCQRCRVDAVGVGAHMTPGTARLGAKQPRAASTDNPAAGTAMMAPLARLKVFVATHACTSGSIWQP